MSEKKITVTNIKQENVNIHESVEGEIGYTCLQSPEKDENGHYVYNGAKEIETSSEKCYAKTVYSNNRERYFVKTGRDGKIFDPWGMYSEGTEKSRVRNEPKWRFSSVSKKCFEYYLKFLQSRNSGWLVSSEREVS